MNFKNHEIQELMIRRSSAIHVSHGCAQSHASCLLIHRVYKAGLVVWIASSHLIPRMGMEISKNDEGSAHGVCRGVLE